MIPKVERNTGSPQDPPARTVTGSRGDGDPPSGHESVPAHAKEFEVEVSVNGQTMGRGHGRAKKLASRSSPQCSWTRYDDPCI